MSLRATIPLLRNHRPSIARTLRSRVRKAEAAEIALAGSINESSSSSIPSSSTSTPLSVFTSSPPTSATPSAQLQTTQRLARSPYRVTRSAHGHLPVYSEFKNDGRTFTIIRKVEGNVQALQKELNAYFQDIHIDPLRSPPQATMKSTNKHLVMKGNWVQEVKAWMEGQGV